MKVKVIIPVFNESGSIGHVLTDIPRDIVNEVIVVNNGSTDDSPEIAASAGATVLSEPVKGYGGACLEGLRYLESLPVDQQPDIVVFMDGDYSDYPEETAVLIEPIVAGKADVW